MGELRETELSTKPGFGGKASKSNAAKLSMEQKAWLDTGLPTASVNNPPPGPLPVPSPETRCSSHLPSPAARLELLQIIGF